MVRGIKSKSLLRLFFLSCSLALSQSSTSIATNPHGLQYTCFCKSFAHLPFFFSIYTSVGQTGFSIVAGKRLNAVATMQKFSFGKLPLYG